MPDLIPDEVLRFWAASQEVMSYDARGENQVNIPDLARELLACRAALRGISFAHQKIVGGRVVAPELNVPHLWDRIHACLPEHAGVGS